MLCMFLTCTCLPSLTHPVSKIGICICCTSLFTKYLCHMIKWGCYYRILLYYYMKQCVTMLFFFHSKSGSDCFPYLHDDEVFWWGADWATHCDKMNVSKVKRGTFLVDIITLSALLFRFLQSGLSLTDSGITLVPWFSYNCYRVLK